MSITAALSGHATTTPDRNALSFENDRLTWRGLDSAVHRVAAHIASETASGAGVALHLPNGPALVLTFLAAARAGREAQVLDPEWTPETTRSVLARLSPGLIVSTDRRFAGASARVLKDGQVRFEDVAEALGAPARYEPVAEPDPLAPFYVGFTSGTTGTPKGYRRHHRSWLESFAASTVEFGIDSRDVILAPGTLTHSLFLYALVQGLNVGAEVVLCRRFRSSSVTRLIAERQVSVLYGVPTQLGLVIDAADIAGQRPFDSMRLVLSSGAKWFGGAMPRLRRLFPQAELAEFYGASELSFVTVAKQAEGAPEGSVGRAFCGAEVSVRDHLGRPLPAGGIGLVFVRSPFLFTGYVGADGGDLLRAGEAVSVGDVGMLDECGFLHLVGRASRMIISSGRNIHPEEIERVLERNAAVEAAAVLGVADARRGERLVALVRLRDGFAPSRAELIAAARTALPIYKVPRTYAKMGHWPLTRSGKVDLGALGRMWSNGDCERLA